MIEIDFYFPFFLQFRATVKFFTIFIRKYLLYD